MDRQGFLKPWLLAASAAAGRQCKLRPNLSAQYELQQLKPSRWITSSCRPERMAAPVYRSAAQNVAQSSSYACRPSAISLRPQISRRRPTESQNLSQSPVAAVHTSAAAAQRVAPGAGSWCDGSRADASHAQRLADDVRHVMRAVPQPVSVLTCNVSSSSSSSPPLSPPAQSPDMPASPGARAHGATLSSLTSISLDPQALVSFSLRLPSRMASACCASFSGAGAGTGAGGGEAGVGGAIVGVSFLSEAQESVARVLSRPPVASATDASPAAPGPSRSTLSDETTTTTTAADEAETLLADAERWKWVSPSGSDADEVTSTGTEAQQQQAGAPPRLLPVPIARGSLGGMVCEIVRAIPLAELGGIASGEASPAAEQKRPQATSRQERSGSGSMLFIARVIKVVKADHLAVNPGGAGGVEAQNGAQSSHPGRPLLYHDRRYVTVGQ